MAEMILNNPCRKGGLSEWPGNGVVLHMVAALKMILHLLNYLKEQKMSVLSDSRHTYSMRMSCRDMYLSEKSLIQFFPEL